MTVVTRSACRISVSACAGSMAHRCRASVHRAAMSKTEPLHKSSSMTKAEREKWRRYIWERIAINPDTMCWEWLKARTGSGYGALWSAGKMLLAHRTAFEAFGGKITTKKRFVLHSCDNPGCANPGHLRAGTPKQNMEDRKSRYRCNMPAGEQHSRAKLTDDEVVEILRLCGAGELTQFEIASIFNVSNCTVSMIARNKIWRHIKRDRVPAAHLSRKLTWEKVTEIRKALQSGASSADLARQHGVTETNINYIKTNKTWVQPC